MVSVLKLHNAIDSYSSLPELLNAWQASVIKGNAGELAALSKSDEVSHHRADQ